MIILKDWKKLTEQEKDKDEYPRGLRKILDEAAGVNILDKEGIFQPIKRKEFPTNQKKVF